ncbi:transcription factor domain-containing protein [Aspergillus foveolatus]|uniref:transcription factor domain-containing protein n=1 Tax=Aspergillus foveolatus TaxID=210207 RepID=UPI003CCE0BAE
MQLSMSTASLGPAPISNMHETAPSRNGHGFRFQGRKPLACETCYKRKVKCEFDESTGTCIQCMRRNLHCKVSKGDKHKRSRYVKSLEERLRKTESLLRAAGISVEEDDAEDDSSMDDDDSLSSNHHDCGRNAESRSTAGRDTGEKGLSKSEDPEQSFDSNALAKFYRRRRPTAKNTPPVYRAEKGYSMYHGRCSPLSLLTREGMEWIKTKSGEPNSLDNLLSNSNFDSPWAYWRPDVFYDVFASKVFKPLPPRAEVFSLLQEYFRTLNLIFPLYHEKTFMELVEWQYTQQTCDDAARWASINIILALAWEYRYSNSQKTERDREKAWLYYKNALSVFPELVLRRTDLLSVQALLGMAIFLRGNSGSQATMPVVTAAIRASHRMGLHREIHRPYLSRLEQQQRKNVFWIAYIIDQSISIRLGSAPTQQLDDYDVGFPSDDTEGLMLVGNKTVFPQLCRISVIRSRTYKHFYSARALEDKSTADICETVHKLDAELQDWRRESQFDILLKQRGSGQDFLVGFASASLFLLYNNTLMMIHRIPTLINFVYQSRAERIPELDLRLILNQSSSSAVLCVQAARDILNLINHLPWGDVAWIWSLLYYIFLAVMTVFVNILRNSQQPASKDDLKSLNMAATFFATLVPADGPCNYVRFMTRMSTAFERIARTVLERDQKMVRPGPDPLVKAKASKSRAANNSRSQTPPHTLPQHQSSSVSASATTTVNIPNLEGLPPINSSGYVVIESPTISPDQSPLPPSSPTSSTNTKSTYSSQPQPQTHASDPSSLPQYQYPPTLHSQQHSYAPSTIPTDTTTSFPLPALEESSVTTSALAPFPYPFSQTRPEPWQIPLTADWEFGFEGQFLGMGMSMGMGAGMGNDMGLNNIFQQQVYAFQGPAHDLGSGSMSMSSAAATVPMPNTMVSTALMEYGYGDRNQSNGTAGGRGDGAGPAPTPGPQSHQPMWFGNAF